MADSNDQLWKEERSSRRSLFLRILILLTSAIFVITLLSLWLAQPVLFGSGSKATNHSVDPNRLKAHVLKLSDTIYPRNHLSVSNLDLAADYIRDEFEKTGGTLAEQVFFVNGTRYRNIILRIDGGPNDRIVVGAHYDAAYDTHGADDNASGVAGLIELAFQVSAKPLDSPVEFVAFSLEEPPYFATEHMGSLLHARSLRENQTPIKLMISLEMIGFYSEDEGSQSFPFFIGRLLYPNKGNFISLVGNLSNVSTVRNFKASMNRMTGIDTYSLNAPATMPGVDFSDHRSYWSNGYDALMVTDTAYFRNKAYHTASDTFDRLDYEKMAKVIGAVDLAIRDLGK